MTCESHEGLPKHHTPIIQTLSRLSSTAQASESAWFLKAGAWMDHVGSPDCWMHGVQTWANPIKLEKCVCIEKLVAQDCNGSAWPCLAKPWIGEKWSDFYYVLDTFSPFSGGLGAQLPNESQLCTWKWSVLWFCEQTWGSQKGTKILYIALSFERCEEQKGWLPKGENLQTQGAAVSKTKCDLQKIVLFVSIYICFIYVYIRARLIVV